MFDFDYEGIRESHRKMDSEFARLCIEPVNRAAVTGDRVVVAIGLLNMGHLWVLEEAVVLEVGDSSYNVRFKKRKDYESGLPLEMWINSNLITDVLK